MVGNSHAGKTCTSTGAAASCSGVASSGSASRLAYAPSTKRHVVSMPFQSSRSLKAARPLTTSPAQNTTTQNHPVPQNHSTNASMARPVRSAVRRGRELQDGLALAHHAHLLAGELLEVRGVAPQALGEGFERLLLLGERAHVSLEGGELLAHLPDPDRLSQPEAREARREEHERGDPETPAASRAGVQRALRAY